MRSQLKSVLEKHGRGLSSETAERMRPSMAFNVDVNCLLALLSRGQYRQAWAQGRKAAWPPLAHWPTFWRHARLIQRVLPRVRAALSGSRS